ncbi:Transposase (or an inactivated derivative) [Streptomyces sp. WMMB 322]|nr:Transposase (or an inactivated derivative) [Streptomyces sp. WMMB 322]
MTDVVNGAEAAVKPSEPAARAGTGAVDEQLVGMLVDRARAEGLQLTGEGGLLQQLTKRVLVSSLEGEMTDHLGYEKHDAAGKNGGNSRNGRRVKTVTTDVGPVEISVPRDTEGSFEPGIVRKRQRRLSGVDEMVLPLSAKGLTHGEISAHLSEVYGASVSRQTISTITDSVIEGMSEWQNRPLDPVYPVVFVDAVRVKIRDGQVANRPIYLAMGVTVDGHRDILGIWAGDGGEGAKYWLQVFTEIKNRGVEDILMLVCDGLKGLPEDVETVWSATIVQTCIIHLLRNSFRYASRADWDKISKALRPVYTAPTEEAATTRFGEFSETWGTEVPGDHQIVEALLGRVRALPRLRRGDPQGHLLDQRDRVRQCPHPQGRPRPRALPQRAGRAEVRLHGADVSGPHRQGTPPMDHALESAAERLRDRLRRPALRSPPLNQPTTTDQPFVGHTQICVQ